MVEWWWLIVVGFSAALASGLIAGRSEYYRGICKGYDWCLQDIDEQTLIKDLNHDTSIGLTD